MDAERSIAARYGRGGARDVRVRALLGVHRIEQGIRLIEQLLNRVRFVGRRLALRFHGRDQRYEWRGQTRGDQGKIWKLIGARVPSGLRLWPQTKAEVAVVERRLDMRQDGRAVLRLVDWLVTYGLRWPVPAVVVEWMDEERCGHVSWTFRDDGRLQRTGNWVTPEVPLERYGQDGHWIQENVASAGLKRPPCGGSVAPHVFSPVS